MSAIPILLADAITAVINADQAASAFGSVSFTAKRSYPTWDDDFKELKDLSVDVVFVSSAGGGVLAELDTEATLNTEPAIDIAVRKRFEPSDRESNGDLKKSAVDPLVKLVEKIYEQLAGDRMQAISLASGISANWIETLIRTHCDYGRLRQGCFLGCVRIRFDVSKVV